MIDSSDLPKDMEVIETILSKTLKSGFLIDVKLVKRPRQYEAALFVNDKYKPGPPLPRPMETPVEDVTHWMGVRPKVGFTSDEADKIMDEVSGQNVLHHIRMVDRWGLDEE